MGYGLVVMGEFPSKAHQFVGGERRGQVQPPIGRRRARKLNKQAAVFVAAFGPEPDYRGSDVQWLRDVRDGKLKPDAAQLAAGLRLLQSEDADVVPQVAPDETMDMGRLSEAQRKQLATLLMIARGDVPPVIDAEPPPPAPAQIQAPTPVAELEAMRAKMAVVDRALMLMQHAPDGATWRRWCAMSDAAVMKELDGA